MISRRLFLRVSAALAATAALPEVARSALPKRSLPRGWTDAGQLLIYSEGGTLLSEMDIVQRVMFDRHGLEPITTFRGTDEAAWASGSPKRFRWELPGGEVIVGSAGVGEGDMIFDCAILCGHSVFVYFTDEDIRHFPR